MPGNERSRLPHNFGDALRILPTYSIQDFAAQIVAIYEGGNE